VAGIIWQRGWSGLRRKKVEAHLRRSMFMWGKRSRALAPKARKQAEPRRGWGGGPSRKEWWAVAKGRASRPAGPKESKG
jgi:hypothetical protein